MKKWISFVVVLIVVFLAGLWVSHYWRVGSKSSLTTSTQKKPEILYWVAPMDPAYRREKPGKSPMGMDLVPVYAAGETDNQQIVKISPAVENNLGVKTATVKTMDLSRIIDTVGHVTADENNIKHIHTYADGWIRTLHVKTTGEVVKKGQLILALYSPTLNNAQEELLLAIKNKNPALMRAGEKKLLTLGMAQSQINQLKQKNRAMQRIKVFATQDGIISQLNVREGEFVKPNTNLMTLVNLSPIWIIAEVFERQAGWVHIGEPAIASLAYLPGKTWPGKVDYIYPELHQKTHTLRVRLTFSNPDLAFKPKMYANIKINSQTVKNALALPRAALIRTGNGDRVILALGEGRFRAQTVKVGIESGDYYQILSDLKAGDVVVTSAQFLIDSESNLKAGLSRMQSSAPSDQKKSRLGNTLQEFVGMGKVQRVNRKKRTLLLHHQPIPALNMPRMTMTYTVDKGIALRSVNAGDEIHFVLKMLADGHYQVIKIQVMNRKDASA